MCAEKEFPHMNDEGMRRSALACVTVSFFLTPFMTAATYIALPSIAADFKMDAVLLSWVATSFTLSSVVSLVPAGRFADIHGRKKSEYIPVDYSPTSRKQNS